MLLGLAPNAATFLRGVSVPSLDVSGSLLCSGTSLLAGRLTSAGGIAITGGGGNFNAGAYLRLLSSGDLVHNTATLGFGNNGVETHLFELSWLGYNHFMRPNASTAWTNTMSIESTRRWRFRKGAYVDGVIAATDISLTGDISVRDVTATRAARRRSGNIE